MSSLADPTVQHVDTSAASLTWMSDMTLTSKCELYELRTFPLLPTKDVF